MPFGEKAISEANHRFGVGVDASAMEGRLRETALAKPEVAFAGKQAIAEETLVGFEDASFGEFARVGDEDLLDVVGMADEKNVIVEGAKLDDVAVISLKASEIFERVAIIVAIEAAPGVVFGAGREIGEGLGGHGVMLCGRMERVNGTEERRPQMQ